MEDVARRAGVSAATVARVIYKNGYVKTETRNVVEEAIRATGYRPNVVARSLRTSKSFTLGLIVSEQRLSAFHPAVNHVIQAEAMKRGYAVLAFNNNGEAALEATGVQRFLDHHVDAVIFCAAIDSSNVQVVVDSGIPAVQVERKLSSLGNILSIDPYTGIKQAVDHLCALGHRSFSYIGGQSSAIATDLNTYDSIEDCRERAFLRAVEENGLNVSPDRIAKSPYFDIENRGKQAAYDRMRTLIGLPDRPTAVICGSDVLAASALQAIADGGLKVPQDISVVGFDDTFARILTPALSSVAQPVEATGVLAVEMALSGIEEPGSAQTNCLTTSFVQRDSTAPPPM